MNRLPMPLAYACARFANGCLLQLQSTVDRVAARPVEQLRKPTRRHPASTHITMRCSAGQAQQQQHVARCLMQEPALKAACVSHPIKVDAWGRDDA